MGYADLSQTEVITSQEARLIVPQLSKCLKFEAVWGVNLIK